MYKYKLGTKFIDVYYRVWEIIGFRDIEPIIQNEFLGRGFWDNGRGLKLLNN